MNLGGYLPDDLFPDELWLNIILFIDCPFDVYSLMKTCHYFNNLCRDSIIQKNIELKCTEWYDGNLRVSGKIYGRGVRQGFYEYINVTRNFLFRTEYYHMGMLSGPVITYHGPFQNVKEYKEYKDGVQSGDHSIYDETGDCIYNQVWDFGFKDGMEILETLKFSVSRNWEKGKRNGVELIMIRDKNSITTVSIPWNDDKIHGVMMIETDEMPVYRQMWDNGKRSEYETIYLDGQAVFIVCWGGDISISAKQYRDGNWGEILLNEVKYPMVLDEVLYISGRYNLYELLPSSLCVLERYSNGIREKFL